MLSAQDLRLTFNPGTPIETKALRGLSLDIPTGQFVTVIGSNGAGKSTFLNSVSGDQSIDSGTIKIDGLDVTEMPVWARAERAAVFAASRAPSKPKCAACFASAWPCWAWGWKTA